MNLLLIGLKSDLAYTGTLTNNSVLTTPVSLTTSLVHFERLSSYINNTTLINQTQLKEILSLTTSL